MSDERFRLSANAGLVDSEIYRAVEFLAQRGYQVWKDGARLVSDHEIAERRRIEQERADLRKMGFWLVVSQFEM